MHNSDRRIDEHKERTHPLLTYQHTNTDQYHTYYRPTKKRTITIFQLILRLNFGLCLFYQWYFITLPIM